MPLEGQEHETLNVKLVHFTKRNSPDEPVQATFSVIDDQGREEIVTGEIPHAYDLFTLFQENGWFPSWYVPPNAKLCRRLPCENGVNMWCMIFNLA